MSAARTTAAVIADGSDLGGTGPITEANAAAVISSWGKDFNSALPHEKIARAEKRGSEFGAILNDVQRAFAEKASAGGELKRGQHAKNLYGTTQASFDVSSNLPKELEGGAFKAGASYRAALRFSNATGATKSDEESDRRGLAIRITDDKGQTQDILLTTGAPEFLAEDAETAVGAAKAEVGGFWDKAKFIKEVGPVDFAKLIHAAKTTDDQGRSLAASTFHSRVPFQLGEHAVKFRLVPAESVNPKSRGSGSDALTEDLTSRLAEGPVKYKLQVQGYKDPTSTPLNDARAEWDSPYVTIAELEIPKEQLNPGQVEKNLKGMDGLSFSVWNRWDDKDDGALKPLGDINAARKRIYEESAKLRGSGQPESKKCPYGYG